MPRSPKAPEGVNRTAREAPPEGPEPVLAPAKKKKKEEQAFPAGNRALSDALARAMATGDTRAARIALTALSGLVDDGTEGGGAPVADLATERRKRGR